MGVARAGRMPADRTKAAANQARHGKRMFTRELTQEDWHFNALGPPAEDGQRAYCPR
jgi:hypothetical protein